MGLCRNKKKEDCPKWQAQQAAKKQKATKVARRAPAPMPGTRTVNGVKYKFG